MPDSPFTASLHRKIKDNLQHNLTRIQQLQGNKGAKLRFETASGRFEVDGNALARTLRNLGKDNQNTASSEQMFEQPLLITLYECRKAMLKADRKPDFAIRNQAQPPATAFDKSLKALRYLRDTTYAGKALHQEPITRVLNRAHQLNQAATRDQIDTLIAAWVRYSLPGELTRFVSLAASDPDVRGKINTGLVTYRGADPAVQGRLTESLIGPVYDQIYSRVYKTGGGRALRMPSNAAPRQFEEGIAAAVRGFGVTAEPQSERRSLANWLARHPYRSYGGFIHFTKSTWGGAARGRIYMHLQADPQGSAALSALRAILTALSRPIPGLNLATDFHKFKIGGLEMIYGCSDSVVMWTTTMEAAKRLAEAMVTAVGRYTVAGLPLGVKPTRVPGIGVSTEPEYQFDDAYRRKEHRLDNYSFGMHRAEIVARGLIAAAAANGGTLPEFATCVGAVAQKFVEYGLDYRKPYKVAQ